MPWLATLGWTRTLQRRWRRRALIIGFAALVPSVGMAASPAEASPAQVTVSLSGSASGTVVAGDTITYTVTIGNSGTTPSGPVTIFNELPGIYVPDSATCGVVSGCTVQAGTPAVSCPIFPPGSNAGICGALTDLEWNIASVPAGASGLTVGAQMTVVPGLFFKGPLSNTAEWSGDGCTASPPALCDTNAVSNPVAVVTVSQSSQPPNGTPVTAGQTIDYVLTLANAGDASSGTITIEDNLPQASGSTLVSGSAMCGTVPLCTVVVAPMANCPSGQLQCPGSLVTWVINAVPAGAGGLALGFSVEVNAGFTGTVVNHARWDGPISPPIQILRTGQIPGDPIFSSGDGCVFQPIAEGAGCFLAYDSNPVSSSPPPTSTTTTSPIATTTTVPVVTAASRSLAFTGPGTGTRLIEWLAMILIVLGLTTLLALRASPRRFRFVSSSRASATREDQLWVTPRCESPPE